MSGFHDIAASAKGASIAVIGILASGFTQLMGILPDDMGKLTSLAGLCVAIAMFNKIRAERRKTQLESELLAHQLKKLKGE
jgi:predicted benzoate:H+ symporter BenE